MLSNGWSGIPVARVQPLVPDYSYEEEFHYALPDDISSGEITEKFGLTKEHVMDAWKRKRDDFCPQKQLEKLISSCGQPDLHLRDDNCTEESGSVHSVVDANDTLAKMLAKVDEFVLKYAREDLRKAVVNEIKRHNAKVKVFTSRMTNASARATENAKTYDDFDWENLIRRNELRNLYVSQLNLYLLRNLKLSHKDCEKKGFTKANKIEEIKKHFYSSQSKESVGREQGPQQAAHQKIHVALDQKSKRNSSPAMLNALPWGGTMTVPH